MSARRAELRRTGALTLLLFVVVLLVGGAVGLGQRIDRTRTLPGLRNRATSEGYARDALGELAPVSAAFTERRIGREALRGSTPEEVDTTPPERPRRRSDPAPPPSIQGRPGSFPSLAPGGWVLTITMTADKSTVQSGDEIRYRMIVQNTGGEEFRGRSFMLEWHTPTNTFGRNAIEQCALVPEPLKGLCNSQRVMFSPGLGEAGHENFNSRGLVEIDPGEQFTHDWFVQVLPSAAEGTRFLNHAHLTVSIDGEDVRITSNDVVVMVG